MIASLLQDAAVASHLIVHHRLDVPQATTAPTAAHVSQSLVHFLIDLDSVVPADASVSMATVDRVLAGLLTRQGYITATIYWSGLSISGDVRRRCSPFAEQMTIGLLRSYQNKFRKDAVCYVPTGEPAGMAAVKDALISCSSGGRTQHTKNYAKVLVCSSSPDVLYAGVHVCRNVERFLQDGVDLDIFVPERLLSLVPAFHIKANLPHIARAELLMREGNFVMGPPRSDEPVAVALLNSCGGNERPVAVAVLWMLQRIAYTCGLPIMTTAMASRLFPSFALLDHETQLHWIEFVNSSANCNDKEGLLDCSGESFANQPLHEPVSCGQVGPWFLLPRASNVLREWWSADMPSWFDALSPIRDEMGALMNHSHSTLSEKGSSELSLTSLWPRVQRNVDPFLLWKLLAVRVPQQTVPFRLTAPLAADLAAPGHLHPAIYLSIALVAGSMHLYEWEWVALLTCCSVPTATLNPLFQCSRDGVLEAMKGLLCVYEHVCRLNEICNGALFPVPYLQQAVEGSAVGAPVPPMDTLRHFLSVYSSSSVDRDSTHTSYNSVLREHGTCCVFTDASAAPHLPTYHRILRAAIQRQQ